MGNHHTGHADTTERSDHMTTMTSTAALAQDSTANTTYWIEGIRRIRRHSAAPWPSQTPAPRRAERTLAKKAKSSTDMRTCTTTGRSNRLHFGARSWGSGGTGSPYTAKHVRLSSRDTHPGPFL